MIEVIPQFKRGDTFYFLVEVDAEIADGYFIGWTHRAQIRTSTGRLIAEIDSEWADPAATTRIMILTKKDTEEWPIGTQELDIQFTRTADEFVRSSVTQKIDVVKDITLPPE